MERKGTKRWFGVGVVGVVLMAGSHRSESNAPGPNTAIADPCALISVAEVSEAMGRPSKAGELTHPFHGNRCRFYDATSQYEIFLQTVDPVLIKAVLKDATAIPGMGDWAYWSAGAVYVGKGNQALMIGFQLPHTLTAMTPAAEKLARTVAGRM